MTSVCIPEQCRFSDNKVHPKRKESTPLAANSFLEEVTPIEKGSDFLCKCVNPP